MVVTFTSQSAVQTQKKQKPALSNEAPKTQQKTVSFSGGDSVQIAGGKASSDQSKLEVVKSFAQGVIRPVKELINAFKNAPIISALSIASIIAASKTVPVVGKLIPIGVAAFGSYKVGSGFVGAIKHHKEGDNAKANESIKNIGEGSVDLALSGQSALNGFKEIKATLAAIIKTKDQTNFVQKAFSLASLKSPETIKPDFKEAWASFQEQARKNIQSMFGCTEPRAGTDTPTDGGVSVDLPDAPRGGGSDKSTDKVTAARAGTDSPSSDGGDRARLNEKFSTASQLAREIDQPKLGDLLELIAQGTSKEQSQAIKQVATLVKDSPESLSVFVKALKGTERNKEKVQRVLEHLNKLLDNDDDIKKFADTIKV